MINPVTFDRLELNKRLIRDRHAATRTAAPSPEFVLSEGDLVTTCYFLPQPEPGDPTRHYDYYHFDTYRIVDGDVIEHWSSDNKLVPVSWERPSALARPAIDPGPRATAAELAANKRLVTDSYRFVFDAQNPGAVADYFAEDYQQHDTFARSGREAFEQFVRSLFPGGPLPVPPEPLVPPTVLMAEGDMVIYAVCRPQPDPDRPGQTYPYYVFNAFRIRDGKLAEHWSGMNKAAPPAMPEADAHD